MFDLFFAIKLNNCLKNPTPLPSLLFQPCLPACLLFSFYQILLILLLIVYKILSSVFRTCREINNAYHKELAENNNHFIITLTVGYNSQQTPIKYTDK